MLENEWTGSKISGELKALRGHGSDRERSSLVSDDPGGVVVDELIGMVTSSQEGCKISGKLKVLRGHGSGRERTSLVSDVLERRSSYDVGIDVLGVISGILFVRNIIGNVSKAYEFSIKMKRFQAEPSLTS
ncbi:2872_t:CDS:2 [Funneliformis mosseae]|uniref:2872_t:CDS:1 n=1 Tax=Funneliformis mosseae TaxID=27381 RepID=A0A9N8Z7C8_FUNMO|nr:2872_t:CDS:2 [Funneliformis mosseae]